MSSPRSRCSWDSNEAVALLLLLLLLLPPLRGSSSSHSASVAWYNMATLR